MATYRPTPEFSKRATERFWKNVVKLPDLPGCWLWAGSFGCDKKGKPSYGMARSPLTGKWTTAHRVAWEVVHGPIPDGLDVLHVHDEPACVNHTFLGTASDNMRDMVVKGRANKPKGDQHPARRHPERLARGETNANSIYTSRQVLAMRASAAMGAKATELARRFGGSTTAVANIINRKVWRHV